MCVHTREQQSRICRCINKVLLLLLLMCKACLIVVQSVAIWFVRSLSWQKDAS